MKRAKFEKTIAEATDLPTLPVVAQRVLQVINSSDSDASELHSIVQLDPVLSAEVLRLANSAFYRMPGTDEIMNVHRAVIVLGFHNIRNVVFATCMRSLYSTEFRTNHFSAGDLWMHSVAVAVIARTLTKHIDPEWADEAFLAGIVHDVGMIVEWNLFPDVFPRVLERFHGTGIEFRKAEREILGFDHCEAGAATLRNWELPKHLRWVASRHHNDDRRRRPDTLLPRIINVAERICSDRGNGFFDHYPDGEDAGTSLVDLGFEPGDYRNLADEMDEELDKARDILTL